MKQGESLKLGSSVVVPHVQDVAKEALTTIPSRYVHPDQDPPLLLPHAASLQEVPVIDFQALLLGEDERSTNLELRKLHHACRDWGFFQLINHGVDPSLVEKMKTSVEDFFKLPAEKKKEFSQEPGELDGYGQAFVVSEEQRLDWCDLFSIVTHPKHLRKLHLFSKLPLQFRETIEAYSEEMKVIGIKLYSSMAKALRIKDEEMMKVFAEGRMSLRMNYYPPCPQPDLAIGLSPHSDASGITVLLQVNEVAGLQIKKDGIWIPIKPLPNAFIVNVGDVMEIITNGIYRSIEHRATVNSQKERLSVAAFFGGDLNGTLAPAPSLVSPETPPLFKTVTGGEFYRAFFSKRLSGKSHLDDLRIDSNS